MEDESLHISVPMGFEAEALEASKLADMEDGLQYYAELKKHMLARTRRFGSLLAGYLLLQVSGSVSYLQDLPQPAVLKSAQGLCRFPARCSMHVLPQARLSVRHTFVWCCPVRASWHQHVRTAKRALRRPDCPVTVLPKQC